MIERKRLAAVLTSMAGGGAERVMLTLARELRGRGHRFAILVLRPRLDYEEASSDEDLHMVPGFEGSMFGRLRRQARGLAALVARLEAEQGAPFDLVLSNMVEADVVTARSGLARVAHVLHVSIRGELRQALARGPHRYLRERRRWAVLDGRHLAAVSPSLAREIEGIPWIRPASLRTVFNPIDVPLLRRLAEAEDPDIPDGPYIVHVGRAARQKRHDVLFEALHRLPEPVRLVCLAHNTDRLRRLARRHAVEGRVVLPGFRQNPYPWIRRARLLVLSSDFEGLPLVLMEALAVGTPVVSTDCPQGPRDVLGADLGRYLVPPRDPGALADAMRGVLEDPPAIDNPAILSVVDPGAVADRYLSLATDLARAAPASGR